MRVIKVQNGQEENALKELKNRKEEDLSSVDAVVKEIILKVIKSGDKALFQLTRDLDGANLKDLKVTESEVEQALKEVSKDFFDILEKASENIRSYHEKQYEKSWRFEKSKDIILGQLINPIESVGVYVPGGKAAYPSTVLMNVIPAKIAKVNRIAITTPAGINGKINPAIIAAAKTAGVDEIYKLGGAQAVAAFAYGSNTIKPVNKIVGPGNIYVARAKKYVYGTVDIDMIAGPSEICIIADRNADAACVAADMLSQAEHDEMAASILITNCEKFAKNVMQEVSYQLKKLSRLRIAQKSIDQNGIVFITEDLVSAFSVSNFIAPEHLELMIEDPFQYLNHVKNAGAVFLGKYSPEPLGDYIAGPNHTLPTGGTAAFASPLGVYDFLKRSSLIYYSKDALFDEKDFIIDFAEKEGLTAHGNAIRVRFDD